MMGIHWHPLRLTFPTQELRTPERVLSEALDAALTDARLHGMRVAVAVGSRAIAGLDRWVALTVAALQRFGAEVVVVPAMGSHGGGTPQAQARVLADLGITSATLGVPVVSRAAVVHCGTTPAGLPIWCDSEAWAADRVLPINRVKPHTAFRGPVESGPSKLLAVGLGKSTSAEVCHRSGLTEAIPDATRFWLATGRVPCGVALVENAAHTSARVAVLRPANWLDEEARLLRTARELLPRLPWDVLDLLVIEQFGKDISGTGMDLNVVGMGRRFPGHPSPPVIHQVVVLNLTPASRGNANGIGYADWVTERLAAGVDWAITRANARTTGFAAAAYLPKVARDEQAALEGALADLRAAHGVTPKTVRAVRIRDTSHLTEIQVSPVLLRASQRPVHRPCR